MKNPAFYHSCTYFSHKLQISVPVNGLVIIFSCQSPPCPPPPPLEPMLGLMTSFPNILNIKTFIDKNKTVKKKKTTIQKATGLFHTDVWLRKRKNAPKKSCLCLVCWAKTCMLGTHLCRLIYILIPLTSLPSVRYKCRCEEKLCLFPTFT